MKLHVWSICCNSALLQTALCRLGLLFEAELHLQIRFLQRRIKGVQPSVEGSDGGRVTLSDGMTIDFDWLVLALGGETNTGAHSRLTINQVDFFGAACFAIQSSNCQRCSFTFPNCASCIWHCCKYVLQ